jgi:RNA polymerase sigma-70 factor, ECF subfamily
MGGAIEGAHDAVEASLRRGFDEGDFQRVASEALSAYGPGIFGLLVALLRDEEDAREAWAEFAEDLWRGLPEFAWRASLRTWLYRVARSAASRVREARSLGARRNVPLSRSPISDLAADVRERTLPHLKTESKNALAELRKGLSLDEDLLLVLRLERKLGWDEIAEVIEGPPLDPADAKRRAALLRKRFQLLKERLRREAEARGLVDPKE